jgi:methyl-accepting chemotaxis protein
MAWKVRGTGVKHTFPFVFRFAALWFLVTVAAVLVAAVTTWMLMAEQGSEGISRALATQTILTVLAVAALAVFTTHRLAGPWIAVKRALDAVRDGDLAYNLRIRSKDVHIKNVEASFNQMLASLRDRGDASTSKTSGSAAG